MKLSSITEQYYQGPDCCDNNIQVITMETQNGGGGAYLVIKTDRWSLDEEDIDVLCAKMKDFLSRAKAMEEDDEK